MARVDPKSGVVAVTGASSGIGSAIAVELAARGFTVACLSRRGTVPEVQHNTEVSRRLLQFQCDVTIGAELIECFQELSRIGVGMTGLVNNAGIHKSGRSSEFSSADFEQVMAVNATAVFTASREAYPYLAATEGAVINIGSFFDKLGVKQNLAYCASKAAVGAITRCLAVEWARDKIRVLNVAPGYIETELNRAQLQSGPLSTYLRSRIPTGSPTGAAAVSKLVAALLEEAIPFLTGETIYIDGGQGVAH